MPDIPKFKFLTFEKLSYLLIIWLYQLTPKLHQFEANNTNLEYATISTARP